MQKAECKKTSCFSRCDLLCSANHACDMLIQRHDFQQTTSSSTVCDTFSDSYWHSDIAKNIMSNFAQSSTGTKIFIIKHLCSEKNTRLQERGDLCSRFHCQRLCSLTNCVLSLFGKIFFFFSLIFDVCLVLFVCSVLLLSVLFLVTTWLRGTRNKIRDFHL